jgi:hypothetical protein
VDQTNILIRSVKALAIPVIEVETNEAKKYTADLSRFKQVHCFPKSQLDWEDVSVTAQGYNLTWGSRFEVSVDQVVDWSQSIETVKKHA